MFYRAFFHFILPLCIWTFACPGPALSEPRTQAIPGMALSPAPTVPQPVEQTQKPAHREDAIIVRKYTETAPIHIYPDGGPAVSKLLPPPEEIVPAPLAGEDQAATEKIIPTITEPIRAGNDSPPQPAVITGTNAPQPVSPPPAGQTQVNTSVKAPLATVIKEDAVKPAPDMTLPKATEQVGQASTAKPPVPQAPVTQEQKTAFTPKQTEHMTTPGAPISPSVDVTPENVLVIKTPSPEGTPVAHAPAPASNAEQSAPIAVPTAPPSAPATPVVPVAPVKKDAGLADILAGIKNKAVPAETADKALVIPANPVPMRFLDGTWRCKTGAVVQTKDGTTLDDTVHEFFFKKGGFGTVTVSAAQSRIEYSGSASASMLDYGTLVIRHGALPVTKTSERQDSSPFTGMTIQCKGRNTIAMCRVTQYKDGKQTPSGEFKIFRVK